MSESASARLSWHLTHPLPLVEHLVLRTESHASCAGLAFFALVGFYPFCLLLLWVSGDLLHWTAGATVIRETLREYYPEGQDFLVRNLEASVQQHGRELTLAAAFWILLGAAGVFIPLETAFNRLWGATEHRPYWRNQAVGFLLTGAGAVLAFLFVFVTAALQAGISELRLAPLLVRATSYAALRLTALSVSVAAVFLLFRFLPNHPVRAREVLPAAIGTGIVAEAVRWVYLQALPLLELQTTQGPYYISVSFALLAYVEAFVLLGGAFAAAPRPEGAATERVDAEPAPQVPGRSEPRAQTGE